MRAHIFEAKLNRIRDAYLARRAAAEDLLEGTRSNLRFEQLEHLREAYQTANIELTLILTEELSDELR
jgi:hypothetical protein